MSPVSVDLPITPGTTFRDTVRLLQPEYAYRAIDSIRGAPLRMSVPDHGLAGDWPVWVRGVSGLPAINREPPSNLPHRAKRVDNDTLELNNLSADGALPVGGQLIYRLPVDIAGAEVRMNFTGLQGDDLLLTLGNGLESPSAGSVTRDLSPEQTALLVGDWRYTFEVEFANGDITRYFEGGQAKAGGCHG